MDYQRGFLTYYLEAVPIIQYNEIKSNGPCLDIYTFNRYFKFELVIICFKDVIKFSCFEPLHGRICKRLRPKISIGYESNNIDSNINFLSINDSMPSSNQCNDENQVSFVVSWGNVIELYTLKINKVY